MLASSLGPFSMQLIASLQGWLSELSGCAEACTQVQYRSSGRNEQMKMYTKSTHRETEFISFKGCEYMAVEIH